MSLPELQRVIERDHAKVDAVNTVGMPILSTYVFWNRRPEVEYLVSMGADVNKTTLAGNTPLSIATLRNYPDLVRYLLECQANPHIQNREGKTALHLALQNRVDRSIRDLLVQAQVNSSFPNGIPSSLTDNEGRTVLYYCSTVEDLSVIVERMSPAILNSKDKTGKTVLAYMIPRVELVEYLVSLPNLNVNLADHYGMTPMHIAVTIGDLDVIRLLLRTRKCNLSLRNSDRRTPLDIAKHLESKGCQYAEVIHLLTEVIRQKDEYVRINL